MLHVDDMSLSIIRFQSLYYILIVLTDEYMLCFNILMSRLLCLFHSFRTITLRVFEHDILLQAGETWDLHC